MIRFAIPVLAATAALAIPATAAAGPSVGTDGVNYSYDAGAGTFTVESSWENRGDDSFSGCSLSVDGGAARTADFNGETAPDIFGRTWEQCVWYGITNPSKLVASGTYHMVRSFGGGPAHGEFSITCRRVFARGCDGYDEFRLYAG